MVAPFHKSLYQISKYAFKFQRLPRRFRRHLGRLRSDCFAATSGLPSQNPGPSRQVLPVELQSTSGFYNHYKTTIRGVQTKEEQFLDS